MEQTKADRPVNEGKISLVIFYLIGVIATTIGILVVAMLNFFTPLASIQTQINSLIGDPGNLSGVAFGKVFVPRALGILGISYLFILLAIHHLLGPIRKYIEHHRKGEQVPDILSAKARKRVLNLPYLFIPINFGMWILLPGAIAFWAWLTGIQDDQRTALILAVRATMVGMIASAVAFHRIESFSRSRLIPFFFPDGRLSDETDVAGISISRRIRMASRLGYMGPMTILMVTLLTLQWEVGATVVSAVEYGRGIIVFVLALFIYAFVISGILNRAVSNAITRPLKEITRVLKEVRAGEFDHSVRVVSNDEIGLIGDVVNEMTEGLRDREKMRQSLALAREIQQNLLPKSPPAIPGLDIAGKAVYCDETGGDYYDFIVPDPSSAKTIHLVMGDVSGHGVSSALLMATTRAFVRQRSTLPGAIEELVSDVNRHFTMDVADSGSFMTLFYLSMDMENRLIRWVRAGHDPALFYDPRSDRFEELDGPGPSLGLVETYEYVGRQRADLAAGQVIVLYTDGIWEAHNAKGEMFGKEHLREAIRRSATLPANEMAEAILKEIRIFQAGTAPEDDVTIVVVKII